MTKAARIVVIGTAATKPIDPHKVRTISTAISSEFATITSDWLETASSIRRGMLAPA